MCLSLLWFMVVSFPVTTHVLRDYATEVSTATLVPYSSWPFSRYDGLVVGLPALIVALSPCVMPQWVAVDDHGPVVRSE